LGFAHRKDAVIALEIIDTEKFKAEIFDFTDGREFEKFDRDKPIILNFFAGWCGPCQSFAPALEEIAEDHPTELTVYKIDIDADPEIPALFGIMSVPTTVFFAPNEEPALATGNIGYDGLKRAIADLFGIAT
jgi:thioredoxin 1